MHEEISRNIWTCVEFEVLSRWIWKLLYSGKWKRLSEKYLPAFHRNMKHIQGTRVKSIVPVYMGVTHHKTTVFISKAFHCVVTSSRISRLYPLLLKNSWKNRRINTRHISINPIFQIHCFPFMLSLITARLSHTKCRTAWDFLWQFSCSEIR